MERPSEVPAAGGDREPLRFGVMCSGTSFAAWQAECIRDLVDSGSAVPALLILDGGAKIPSGRRRLGSSTLWHAFNNRWSGPRSRSLRTTDLTDLLAGLPRLTVEPIRKGRFSQLFADGDVRTIEEHRLDFILRFAFGIIRGDILNAARHGICPSTTTTSTSTGAVRPASGRFTVATR